MASVTVDTVCCCQITVNKSMPLKEGKNIGVAMAAHENRTKNYCSALKIDWGTVWRRGEGKLPSANLQNELVCVSPELKCLGVSLESGLWNRKFADPPNGCFCDERAEIYMSFGYWYFRLEWELESLGMI
ncbi:hypothetical protein AVEN_94592-1 [Araneus ventricosus]|uniref:Uncharacterized protein n=1 Tax=Araneus ventricosus TaxID=182803 RepID=A0A4Y2IN61_ARAVE|nr:hypothetical protein AVEN_94592-1 [Araneus ventricosus]